MKDKNEIKLNQTEKKHELEEIYRGLVKTSPDGITLTDIEGRIIICNHETARLHGYENPETMYGLNAFDMIVPEDRQRAIENAQRVLKMGSIRSVAYTLLRKDKSTFPAEISASVVRDPAGNPKAFIGITRDITERKWAEKIIRSERDKLQALMDGLVRIGLGIDIVGIDYRVLFQNQTLKEKFGDLTGKLCYEGYMGLNEPCHSCPMIKAINNNSVESTELTGIDGRDYELISAPLLNPDGTIDRAIEVIRDFTERKRIEEIQRESEEKYRTIADFTYDWEYWISPDGKYIYISPSCERVTGYQQNEFMNDPELIVKITHTDDRLMVKKHFCEILQGHGDICHMDFRIITRNGKERWLSHSCQPVYGLDGRWLGRRGSNHDITERKKAEEGLKQLAIELECSNTELKQFAYAASHDLQEPLNVIGGYVRLLARRYKDKLDASADEFIGYIIERIANMQKLIKDLLEFSQVGMETKKFEPITCASVVTRAIANLQTSIEESGALVTYDALPTVMTDSSQLCRLFQNLIGNAIKFRREETPKIHISAERGRNEWVFSVRDNGIGIEKKDTERIFAVFQRVYGKSKYPGTGIGLAICKKIVEQHRGRIWVESEPGNGSTFHFTIPFSE